MRIRVRSGYRAPAADGEGGSTAYGDQDTRGRARSTPPFGLESLGEQGTAGSATHLLVRAGVQDTTGRVTPRIGARGAQDTIGRATPAATTSTAYFYSFVLDAHDDLASETITSHVVRLHLVEDYLKQAPTGRLTNADAWDLRVQTPAGADLDHQVEFYQASTGTIDIAFRIPSYNTNADYPFRLKLGSLT